MDTRSQSICMFKEFLECRESHPAIAKWFEFFTSKKREIIGVRDDQWFHPYSCLLRMDGLLGEW